MSVLPFSLESFNKPVLLELLLVVNRNLHWYFGPVITWIYHLEDPLLVASRGVEPLASKHESDMFPLHQLALVHIANHENKSTVLYFVSQAEHFPT